MKEKEEERVINNLENFNVFDEKFIDFFYYFYETYDFELPEEYKNKLLTVLSDYSKVKKDSELKLKELEGSELKEIDNYVWKLYAFTEHFSLMNVFKISEKEFNEYRTIFEDNSNSEDRNKDYDSVLNYEKEIRELLYHFTTQVCFKIENPFLKELKKTNDERISELNLFVSFNYKMTVLSLDVKDIFDELRETLVLKGKL